MRLRCLLTRVSLVSLLGAAAASSQTPALSQDVRWSFHKEQGASPVDEVRGGKGKLEGMYQYVPGVSGDGLRFDGYTTGMTVAAKDVPIAGPNGFTVEAWVALNTYPWNRVPIVDQESAREAGYFFGIDAFGHVVFEASINGQWQSAVTTEIVPLKRWLHLAGIYQTKDGRGTLTVFMDGNQLCQRPVDGELSPARTDLLIGRVRQATLPFPEAEVKPAYPVWYSLDGILDEVTIYGRPLSKEEMAKEHETVRAPQGEVLPWPKMPSGPAGPGRFGAFYANLKYEDAWDNLRQIGPDSDVVVRFDGSPSRLVFWQGTNYVPAWVSGDDIWYTDEFLESWDFGCPDGGDCEPMSDKQGRFSHVELLESNEARAVIHWRYALIEAVDDKPAWLDKRTGWSDWADEYWTVYPDGVATRKQVLHSAKVGAVHEWQETIVLHQPGRRPEDDIDSDAITLGNMLGQTKTYTWQPKTTGAFADPVGPAAVSGPPEANMQLVNTKSTWKPFQIVPPDGVSADFYNNEKSYFQFECWNHWPVAQIASSDRPCVSNDRPSHSSLSHLFWKNYAQSETTATKILMDGLTTKSLPALLPLAKSWLSPAPLQVEGSRYLNTGYDPTQRAYVLTAREQADAGSLRFTLQASTASPVFHPAILIQSWGERGVHVFVDGRPIEPGKSLRVAHIPRIDSTDLLIWMETSSTKPVQIEVGAANR